MTSALRPRVSRSILRSLSAGARAKGWLVSPGAGRVYTLSTRTVVSTGFETAINISLQDPTLAAAPLLPPMSHPLRVTRRCDVKIASAIEKGGENNRVHTLNSSCNITTGDFH